MSFHPTSRRTAAKPSISAGVTTKLSRDIGSSLARQTVRSLVLPPMRMTPSRPSNRINPSTDLLSSVK
jgi:hypothetical protein